MTRRWLLLLMLCVPACERDAPPEILSSNVRSPDAAEVVALASAYTAAPIAIPPPPPLPPITAATRWFRSLPMSHQHGVRDLCRQRRLDPCAGLLGSRSSVIAQLSRGDVDAYCAQVNGGGSVCETPLVIAFDGQPVEFTAAAWPTAETPWIALDRDGDGAITARAELFGDATVLPSGSTASHGYEALAALDADGSGTIDAADPAFARLLLWADADGDRVSGPGELRPLADVVVEIPLAYTLDPRRGAHGAWEGERGAVRWVDSTGVHTGAVVDVYLPR